MKKMVATIVIVLSAALAAVLLGSVFVFSCLQNFPSLRSTTWQNLPNTVLVCTRNVGKKQMINCLEKHPEYNSGKLFIGVQPAWRIDGQKCVRDYPEIDAQKADFDRENNPVESPVKDQR